MTSATDRTGVCAWCGATFVAPPRGRIPTYCKTSHRIRAYEQRKMAAAVAEAEQRAPAWGTGPGAQDGADGVADLVRVTTSEANAAAAQLRPVVARTAGAAPTRPTELRQEIAEVAFAVRKVLAAAGLPEVDPDDEPWWSLVVPVSDALRRADSAVTAAPRSSRTLQLALDRLLSAAAALADLEANGKRFSSGPRQLAVAVPGPAGFAGGTFETETVGRSKRVYWAAQGTYATQPLPQLAGRPEGFRYRWDDKRVWEQLARDMIVVACGWQSYPERLPPALARAASGMLSQQLRSDLGSTSEWAIHTQTIVNWMARTGFVTVISPDEALVLSDSHS